MKFIYSVLVLCWALSARADIILYKNAVTVTRTGAGTAKKFKITGWTIIDGQTGDLTTVLADPVAHTFSHETPSDYEMPTVSAAGGKSLSVIALYGGTIKGSYIKGTANLKNPHSMPTTGKVTGSDLFTFVGNDVEYLDEYGGTLVLDKKLMADANSKGYTLQNAVDSIRNNLLSLGYTER
jgi:hypothetical protein